jgi:hypothetical protein
MTKQHMVMPRTKTIKKIQTSKGEVDVSNGPAWVEESIANEIESTVGLKGTGDVWTHEDPRLNWDRRYKREGHTYFFGAPRSKKYQKNYEKIFGHR